MAHFAQLDSSNKVTRVIVIGDGDCLDNNGVESEAAGIAFCRSLYGQETQWAQTSYNNKIRKRYAGIGYTYDESLDAFITPSPFPSWTLNTSTCDWQAPVPYPSDGKRYRWDEDNQCWVKVGFDPDDWPDYPG